MPDFDITSPDGKKYRVTAPATATQEQILSYAKQHFSNPSAAPTHYNPTEGMSGTQRVFAGVGQGMTSVGRGVEQAVTDVSAQRIADRVDPHTGQPIYRDTGRTEKQKQIQQQIDEAKSLDAPLLATGAGRTGSIIGQSVAAAPAALIPGGQTLAGGALIGAGLGALQPVATGDSRLRNTELGAAGGAIGSAAGKVMGGIANALGKSVESPAATAIASGRKLPPSMAKIEGANPGLITQFAESLAGKTRIEQGASLHNENVNTRVIRKGLGLPEGDEIHPQEIEQLRSDAGDAYEEVKRVPGSFNPNIRQRAELDRIGGVARRVAAKYPGIFKNDKIEALVDSIKQGGMSADEAIEITKKLRFDANANIGSQDAQTKALGLAQKRAASVVEDMLSDHLQAKGSAGLYRGFTQARQLIAKSYDVENSLTSRGKINAVKLANLSKKRRLSDELLEVAEFGKRFGGAARDTSKAGSRLGPAISKPELGAAAIAAAAGHGGAAAKLGHAAALTGVPWLARKAVLSAPVQRAMISPRSIAAPRVGAVIGANTLADLD